jgi:hemerythrin superfamily protein
MSFRLIALFLRSITAQWPDLSMDLLISANSLYSLLSAIAGASAGEKDVCDLLMDDHREALDMMQKIQQSDNPDTKRTLANTVITELVRHSVAEETIVYPMIAKVIPDGEKWRKQDIEEHHQLEEIMAELEKANAELPEFNAITKRLQDALEHHRYSNTAFLNES